MKLSTILFICLTIVGILYHSFFLQLNEVLKVADSFAYLQMSYYIWQWDIWAFWNGWFWFLYSLPIAVVGIFIWNQFLAAQITNLILLTLSSYLLWDISKRYTWEYAALWVVILFLLSPIYLHFSIHVLSENLYIPLFLLLFSITLRFLEELYIFKSPSLHLNRQKKQVVQIGIVIGLLYLTRAEAFIYLTSIWILALAFTLLKKITWKNFFLLWSLFFVSFLVIISPYLYFLHDLTWEWGLTNKWASNLRQAELRWQDKMDDAWFEQAVAELTADNHHLIAGFAGWMPYDTPQIEGSLIQFISNNPSDFLRRFLKNQSKLYTQNLPEIFVWKSPSLYLSSDSRFAGNIFFLLWACIPFLILIFWVIELLRKEKIFVASSISFFLPACIFFTLFFTLNRYFLIFLPLMFLVYMYGVSRISEFSKILAVLLIWNIISLLLLSTLVYFNEEKNKDEYYSLKQEAWVWMNKNIENNENLKIMERFPIVSYYAWSKIRYITPYTDNIWDIYEYWLFHNINYLIVDSMDFQTYRPELTKYLEETPEWFTLLREFINESWQKVIIYKLNK